MTRDILFDPLSPVSFGDIFFEYDTDNTVKLGYNDHGYNEFTLIPNKITSHLWSQMTGYKDIFHGYNESRL